MPLSCRLRQATERRQCLSRNCPRLSLANGIDANRHSPNLTRAESGFCFRAKALVLARGAAYLVTKSEIRRPLRIFTVDNP